MGVIRFPRPTGIYVPSSPTRTLTNDMISPPLSPDFNFDSEILIPSILPALEYISSKLQQRMLHVTLLVGRGKPFPTGQSSDLMIIPTTHLETSSWRVLERAISKASKKFSLGQSWSDALNRSQHERQANEYLVEQSILQNEVVFSQEGLTLLNMDRIYTFKRRLCILSTKPFSRTDEQYMNSCVQLLRRLVIDFQGRPFSKAFFHRVYEQLDVRDDLLTTVALNYKSAHKQEAIVLPPRATAEHSRKSPVRTVRVRRQPPPAKSAEKAITASVKREPASDKPAQKIVTIKRQPASTTTTTTTTQSAEKSSIKRPAKRGPKTPLSASDVTPITRNEWNMLVGQDIREVQPSITQWIPSPLVTVA